MQLLVSNSFVCIIRHCSTERSKHFPALLVQKQDFSVLSMFADVDITIPFHYIFSSATV